MDTVGAWLDLLDELYPSRHAASWDNVGLQVGDTAWPVERVMLTLDVTSDVVAEAAAVPATLLVAHHPLLFRPLERLTPSTAAGKVALAAAQAGVAVTAAHTNLDVATDGAGTSQPVADVLGVVHRRPLRSSTTESSRCKLVAFVPGAVVDDVLDAVSLAGAGRIGDYERCSFRVLGTGTFRPLPGTNPHSGEGIGVDAAEEEFRLEVEVERSGVGPVISALLAAHPYEEVAYDLVPLLDGADVGLGIVGDLLEPRTLAQIARVIREELPSPHLRFAGDPDRVVSRVAVVGGAGDSMTGAALGAGADVYVTGDLRHHVTLDALELGLAMIDAGHHATEAAALPAWRERLIQASARSGLQAPVIASSRPTVPWR